MKISILIPCLNEELTIAQVVAGFRKALPGAQVYVFDNASDDNTIEKARQSGALVRTVHNRGKGQVVTAMFREVESDFYVMVDGDDTYPPEKVEELLASVISGECDMAVGKRIPAPGSKPFPLFHRFGNRIITRIINAVFKSQISDVFSGYRAFNHRIIHSLPLLSKGFDIETEMTLQALDKGFTIAEIDVPYRERPSGSQSKLNTYWDGLLVFKTILAIIKDYKPLAFFCTFSLICFLFSILFGSVVINEYFHTHGVRHVSTAVLATGLMILSLLSLTTGLILDSTKRHFAELHALLINQNSKSQRQDSEFEPAEELLRRGIRKN